MSSKWIGEVPKGPSWEEYTAQMGLGEQPVITRVEIGLGRDPHSGISCLIATLSDMTHEWKARNMMAVEHERGRRLLYKMLPERVAQALMAQDDTG